MHKEEKDSFQYQLQYPISLTLTKEEKDSPQYQLQYPMISLTLTRLWGCALLEDKLETII